MEGLLQNKGPKEQLVFVGDGINDAPVLSRADIGVAMGAMGSDAAIEAADIVLMDDDLKKLPVAVRIARKTLRIVRENIVFALAVKFLVLILSAVAWPHVVGRLRDVGVSVIAILNSMRMLNANNLLSLKKKVGKEILCETAFRLYASRDRSKTCPFSLSKKPLFR